MFFCFLSKFHSRICASVLTGKRDESFSQSINSDPYPAVVYLNRVQVCISSDSTTSTGIFLGIKQSVRPILLPNSKDRTTYFQYSSDSSEAYTSQVHLPS